MAVYMTGALIKKLRERKGWQQSYMQKIKDDPADLRVTLSRIENQRQQPTAETLASYLDLLEMPYERFFCPHLENNTPEASGLRDRLLYCLDACENGEAATAEAQALIERFTQEADKDSLPNRQFILGCRAQLHECKGEHEDARLLATEGMGITFPHFDEAQFNSGALLFYEAELLHTLALVYLKTGQRPRAMDLLARLHEGVKAAPLSTVENERNILRIARTQMRCQMEDGEYEKALEMTEQGLNAAIHRNMGQYVPDFAYGKALCLLHMGNKDEGILYIKYAFFACAALDMQGRMREIQERACGLFGVKLNLCGFDSPPPETAEATFHSLYRASGDNLGDVIRQLREHMGIKPKDVYTGLCSQGNYSMLENGQIKSSGYFLLQAIFQRLGHEMNEYFHAFLSQEDMDDMQLSIDIQTRIAVNQYEEARGLIETLKQRRFAKQDYGKQFLMMTETIMDAGLAHTDLSDHFYDRRHFDRFMEALRITLPAFDLHNIKAYRYTANELGCLSNILFFLRESGQYGQCFDLYQQLIPHLQSTRNRRVQDYYLMLLSNYANLLIHMERYEDAIPVLQTTRQHAAGTGRFTRLPDCAGYLMGICLARTGKKEESKPCFALGYYLHGLCKNTEQQDYTAKEAKESAGIEFY